MFPPLLRLEITKVNSDGLASLFLAEYELTTVWKGLKTRPWSLTMPFLSWLHVFFLFVWIYSWGPSTLYSICLTLTLILPQFFLFPSLLFIILSFSLLVCHCLYAAEQQNACMFTSSTSRSIMEVKERRPYCSLTKSRKDKEGQNTGKTTKSTVINILILFLTFKLLFYHSLRELVIPSFLLH